MSGEFIELSANRWIVLVDGKPLRDFIGIRYFSGKASAEAALADEAPRAAKPKSLAVELHQTADEAGLINRNTTIHDDGSVVLKAKEAKRLRRYKRLEKMESGQ